MLTSSLCIFLLSTKTYYCLYMALVLYIFFVFRDKGDHENPYGIEGKFKTKKEDSSYYSYLEDSLYYPCLTFLYQDLSKIMSRNSFSSLRLSRRFSSSSFIGETLSASYDDRNWSLKYLRVSTICHISQGEYHLSYISG